jgi:hypothetical protein
MIADLYTLIEDPDSYWIVYDLCLENNWADINYHSHRCINWRLSYGRMGFNAHSWLGSLSSWVSVAAGYYCSSVGNYTLAR